MGRVLEASAPAVAFAAGLAAGYHAPWLAGAAGAIVLPLLAILAFLVGVEASASGGLREAAGEAPLGLTLAAAGAAGSILFSAAVAPLAGVPVGVAAATGAGLGWYSFTGPYLAEALGPEAGLVGFTANLAREALAIVAYPLLPSRLRVPGVAMGGATTMDTMLPVIAAYGGPRAALIALSHGLAATLSVPVLIPAVLALLH